MQIFPIKQKTILFALVLTTVLLLQSCDSLYRIRVIVELPDDQEYTLSTEKMISRDSWIMSVLDLEKVLGRGYRGLSMIYDRSLIGPGLNKPNLATEFWDQIGSLIFTGSSNQVVYRLRKEDMSIFKQDDMSIILFRTNPRKG